MILFAEDHPATSYTVVNLLRRRLGVQALPVFSGEEAVAELGDASRFRLAIVDLHLGGAVTGRDVAELAVALGVPTLIWTGNPALAPSGIRTILKEGVESLLAVVTEILS